MAWLTFKLPNFDHVVLYVESIFNNFWIRDKYDMITFIFIYSMPVILYHIAYIIGNQSVKRFESLSMAIMLFLIVTNSGTSQEFIYFQF
jgi:alginate O-acetyltransferase complex protein AlgI